jgi:hypothetical protein
MPTHKYLETTTQSTYNQIDGNRQSSIGGNHPVAQAFATGESK